MARLDYAAAVAPITDDDPCGPDLDAEGDADFLQFMARADHLLPASFFTRDEEGRPVPFDRASIDFKAEFATLAKLLDATHDLRLLSIACRLHALDRDLGACADGLEAVARLLRERWDSVHPRGEDGDFGYRVAVLQALDDAPTMILPLQHLPLFAHRRHGPISLRTATVASGGAQPRPGETALDAPELERVLRDADPAAREAALDGARRLRDAALAIAATSAEAVGGQNAARLDRVVEVAEGIAAFLRGTDAAEPAPAAPDETAPAGGGTPAGGQAPAIGQHPAGASPAPPGAVSSFPAALAALGAVIGYFDAHEPSSPAALLVRQAKRLVGLPFHDVIRALLPDHAGDATVYIGPSPDKSFQISLDRMTEAMSPRPDADEADAGGAGDDPGSGGPAAGPTFAVASRSEAIALLRQVGGFYRQREPASPIPLFTERACALADKDFLTILADVLPGVRLARDVD